MEGETMNKVKNRRTADNCLRIYTLGRFEVYRNGVRLSEYAHRSTRVWDLFKYLLTYRDRSSTPEAIIETLWPQHNYADPRRALRTPVYRLRQILSEDGLPDAEEYILYIQGCYVWNNQSNFWVDADEFENLLRQAAQIPETELDKKIDLYLQAIDLYRGEYLPENLYADWTIAQRNHYRRLYLEAIDSLAVIYQSQQRYQELTDLCERAITLEPFEESLHVYYMDGLIRSGHHKHAREHYRQVTHFFYTELGVKPSRELQQLYRELQNAEKNLQTADYPQDGAFFCNKEIFASICNLEQRRGERTGNPVILGKVMLEAEGNRTVTPEKTDHLIRVLLKVLRKGDVVTKNDNNQLQIILNGIQLPHTQAVIARIKQQLAKQAPPDCRVRIET